MAKVLKAEHIHGDLIKEIKESICGAISLASVRIGDDYSSGVYFSQQEKLASELAVDYKAVVLPKSISMSDFAAKISELNCDDSINGIVINKPFPSNWKEEEVFSLIDAKKDIEGMNPYSLGLLIMGRPMFVSPTVKSILKFISLTGVDLKGKEVVIVGASMLIGRPLAPILTNMMATVSVTHIETYNSGHLPDYLKRADIIVSSVGKADLIKAEWVKEGAVVIDVGISRKDGHIAGDVEFDGVSKKASFITPVPGGVGKLTTLFLFGNLVKAAKNKCRK
ncbi:MAG: bifunctional 5,10-methylenetetrahydrofolate dehydrogenase/5,10-methenyltetrahydrofolate cyclohydrolase [Candidatus Omnitrophica bacterium]|nr:bifunctional 5,10-methylenetetrahydrofolate dehydrogenase/5,10-methenyltetrahydrofolate cyclohydrolase [Candidatus Omnitrophota bacterium]